MIDEEKKLEALIGTLERLIESSPRVTEGQLLALGYNSKAVTIALERTGHKKKDNSLIEISKNDKSKFERIVTEYVNKDELIEKILEIQPVYYDNAHLWWVWDHKKYKWVLMDETDILVFVKSLSNANTINLKDKGEIMEALRQESRIRKPKDIPPNWIQFKDVIFDITKGEQFKATPKYFVTNPIPYQLHEKKYELTPIMDRIFEEWVGKEYVQTLYEIIAYCMLPDYPIHRLFCFIGSGMNGKSKFMELLQKIIGPDNISTTELDLLMTSRFEISKLHKKLVCLMGETNFNEMNKTSRLKKLTGGDLIGFEYKNKSPFEAKNYAKILIATNNLPTTTDKTFGFYRRWMIIDFPNRFSEEKDILKEIPEEEYECLALKCTGILHDLLIERKFHKEGEVEERMERYESKSDFLQKFLNEFTESSISDYITKADFHKKFASWCKENRHREMAESTLGKKMKDKGIEGSKKYVDWLYDGRGGQIRVWLDLKWKN